MGNLYNLKKETLFLDDILDINHILRGKLDITQAEEDFKELEEIAKDEGCLKCIKEAKESFEIMREKVKNGVNYLSEEYFELLRMVNEYLSQAYDIFIKNFIEKVDYSITKNNT